MVKKKSGLDLRYERYEKAFKKCLKNKEILIKIKKDTQPQRNAPYSQIVLFDKRTHKEVNCVEEILKN